MTKERKKGLLAVGITLAVVALLFAGLEALTASRGNLTSLQSSANEDCATQICISLPQPSQIFQAGDTVVASAYMGTFRVPYAYANRFGLGSLNVYLDNDPGVKANGYSSCIGVGAPKKVVLGETYTEYDCTFNVRTRFINLAPGNHTIIYKTVKGYFNYGVPGGLIDSVSFSVVGDSGSVGGKNCANEDVCISQPLPAQVFSEGDNITIQADGRSSLGFGGDYGDTIGIAVDGSHVGGAPCEPREPGQEVVKCHITLSRVLAVGPHTISASTYNIYKAGYPTLKPSRPVYINVQSSGGGGGNPPNPVQISCDSAAISGDLTDIVCQQGADNTMLHISASTPVLKPDKVVIWVNNQPIQKCVSATFCEANYTFPAGQSSVPVYIGVIKNYNIRGEYSTTARRQ